MPKINWEEQIREKYSAYKSIVSDEQIEESIKWETDFISSLLSQQKQEIIKVFEENLYIPELIKNDKIIIGYNNVMKKTIDKVKDLLTK